MNKRYSMSIQDTSYGEEYEVYDNERGHVIAVFYSISLAKDYVTWLNK